MEVGEEAAEPVDISGKSRFGVLEWGEKKLPQVHAV
jgi:hypothetical protein